MIDWKCVLHLFRTSTGSYVTVILVYNQPQGISKILSKEPKRLLNVCKENHILYNITLKCWWFSQRLPPFHWLCWWFQRIFGRHIPDMRLFQDGRQGANFKVSAKCKQFTYLNIVCVLCVLYNKYKVTFNIRKCFIWLAVR